MPTITLTTSLANLILGLQAGRRIILRKPGRSGSRWIVCNQQDVYSWARNPNNHGEITEDVLKLLLKHKLIEEIATGVTVVLPYRKLWKISERGMSFKIPPRKFWVKEEQ